MPEFISLPEIFLKLALAVVLGGVVGWERETLDRPAGLRTHVLVCVGSAVYMILSMSFPGYDPARIAAQVATGMGFLGAGTIIRHGNVVRGLTTAASLWAIAAVGLCVGRGGSGYVIAISTTAFVFVTLRGLSWVEKHLVTKRQYRQATMRLRHAREIMPRLESLLDEQGARIHTWEIGETGIDGTQEMRLTLRLPPGLEISRLTCSLTSLAEVLSLEWD